MAPLISTNLQSLRENLDDIISDISPSSTPVLSSIGKTKATQEYNQFLTDTLAPANKDNAGPEGAPAPTTTLNGPTKIGNHTQIFRKVVDVSNSTIASNTAGAKDEFLRQVVKAGKELKLDMEASIVSDNASVGGSTRKSAGMGAWISTNAMHGAGGSTPGFASAIVGDVVDGTTRPLTEDLFNDMIEEIYGHTDTDELRVIAPPKLKKAISQFDANATKYNVAATKKATNTIDIYVNDFSVLNIGLSRYLKSTSIIAYNPELWAWASLRPVTKIDLAVTGDAKNMMLVTEGTLQSRNETGNGKLADVTPV